MTTLPLVYQVGGCVRDTLLGLPVKDRDWVVVGETPASMLARGFRQVGHDFPVFLHPASSEEYALARHEQKTGPGHTGFATHTTGVPLEEDLQRRDLTINAMAMTLDGQLIDPFGGRQDLASRQLRHVSPAFVEDPLRVLRVARFHARLASLGFTVAPATLALMQQLSRAGELDHLTPERVWQEMAKALATPNPAMFFRTLADCDALARVLPELASLMGKTQPIRYHPEGDAWAHTLEVLSRVTRQTPHPVTRFAALVHDLGKGLTPAEQLPHHYGHEELGIQVITRLAQRLRLPAAYLKAGVLAAGQHGRYRHLPCMRPGTVVRFLTETLAFRDVQSFRELLLVCAADLAGREDDHPHFDRTRFIETCLTACLTVTAAPYLARGLQGVAVGEAIRRERIRRVAQIIATWS